MLVLVKIINSVFSSFILSALEVIHLITSNMQFCNLMMAALIASWWLSHWRYIWVSSAYVWYWRPCRRIIVVNGYTYIVYNRAPKTEPCGTPQLASRDSEKTSFTHTLLSLLLKNDSNHWSTVPSTPCKWLNLRIHIVWSTVSKAAERSSELYSASEHIKFWMMRFINVVNT